MIYLMNELSHKSGSMYELTHGYEILFMPPKVIILSHAMSYLLEKRRVMFALLSCHAGYSYIVFLSDPDVSGVRSMGSLLSH